MKLPADGLVLVADGRKAIILRNAGDEKFPNLRTEWSATDQNPRTADQGTDRPGRVRSNHRRSSVEQTDWHEQQEIAFAKLAAASLAELVEVKKAHHIVIVAPPRTLAVLRRSLKDNHNVNVIGEFPHDLVNQPIGSIEAFISRTRIAS